MSHFRPIDRDIDFLLPPSVQERLPQGHLVRYVVEVVEGPDLSELEQADAGRGSAPCHPPTSLSLLIYGYATGCFSSRKKERATYDSLAFRSIACNRHPDHDTLSSFRRRFRKALEGVFVEPLIALPRDEQHPHWSERFGEPPAPQTGARPVERMANGLKTRTGRAAYALCKQTVEPVFGIIKSVMGFRQFLTRGLDNVQGEWTLVSLAWNLKHMAVLHPQ